MSARRRHRNIKIVYCSKCGKKLASCLKQGCLRFDSMSKTQAQAVADNLGLAAVKTSTGWGVE